MPNMDGTLTPMELAALQESATQLVPPPQPAIPGLLESAPAVPPPLQALYDSVRAVNTSPVPDNTADPTLLPAPSAGPSVSAPMVASHVPPPEMVAAHEPAPPPPAVNQPPYQASVGAGGMGLGGGFGTILGGLNQEKAAIAAQGRAAAQGQTALADLEAQNAEWQRQREEQFNQARAGKVEEYNRTVDDLRSGKIDPKQMWNSKSAGEKTASLIGIMLSGIGSGLSGQPNLAIESIDKQIERDINAQNANLDKKRTMVSVLREQLGDQIQAENTARAYHYAGVEAQLKEAAARAAGPMEQAKAAQMLAQVEQKKGDLINQIAMRQMMISMAQGQGGGSGQFENGQYATRPENPMEMGSYAKAANEDMGRTLPPRTLGGKPVLAHDKQAATTARAQLQGIRGAQHVLEQIEAQRDKTTGLFPTNATKNLDTKLTDLAFELARAKVGGQPSSDQVKEFEKMLSGPFMGYVRGETAYKPIADLIEAQRAAIYETQAPGLSPAGRFVPGVR